MRGEIQLSKLNGREGRKINRMEKRTLVRAPVTSCLYALFEIFMTIQGRLSLTLTFFATKITYCSVVMWPYITITEYHKPNGIIMTSS